MALCVLGMSSVLRAMTSRIGRPTKPASHRRATSAATVPPAGTETVARSATGVMLPPAQTATVAASCIPQTRSAASIARRSRSTRMPGALRYQWPRSIAWTVRPLTSPERIAAAAPPTAETAVESAADA